LDISSKKLGAGSIKGTLVFLASLFVNDFIQIDSSTLKKMCFESKFVRNRDTEKIALSLKGNKTANAMFYKAKLKLESCCGRKFADTDTVRALLILASDLLERRIL
jgi:hypothetical protein